MKNDSLHRCGIAATLSLGAIVTSASAQRSVGPPTLTPHDAVISAMGLQDGRVVALPVGDVEIGARFSLDLPMGPRGEIRRVDFGSHDVRTAGFELIEDRGEDGLVSIDPGPARTIQGRAPEAFGAVIRGSLLDDGLHAVFRWPDGRIQWIEPVGAHVQGFADDLHVLYDNDAIPPSGGICGTPAPIMGPDDLDADDGPPPLALLGGGAVFCAELACDADYEYYQDYGSNSTSVQDRIELIITASNSQYESQTAIRHEITQILVRTNSNDPYTSNDAVTLLCQFITEWTNNQAGVSRDVAHLFTGRSIDGGTIGIAADIGDICDTSGSCSGPILFDGAYCLAQSDCCGSLGCTTDLTTHELGHLWDAFHCDCTGNTMNPFITCSNSFASSSINSIVNHRDSRNCLDICEGGGGGDDGYCAATCTDTTYEYVASLSMPDAGLSNTSGSSGYVDYTALTATVAPGSVQPLNITNGDPQWASDLLAVYIDWNADEDFEDAGENVANATGTGPYALSFTVPAGQPEGTTRMRVRIHDGEFDSMAPCGTATYGEVEDYTIQVLIVDEPCVGDINGDGQVNGADLGLLLGSWGACPSGCPADLNDDGQVNGADLGLMLGAWGACP